MMPKRLINLWFHIDTDRINSSAGLCSMNRLEKWHCNGVIRLSTVGTTIAFLIIVVSGQYEQSVLKQFGLVLTQFGSKPARGLCCPIPGA